MKISSFSEDNLANCLSNNYTSPKVVKAKHQFQYFLKYLGEKGLDAKIIIEEDKYINRDFLNDFISYYALCFENYPKHCKRVHFFGRKVNTKEFEKAILGDLGKKGEDEIWESYLGYIVVKPIPVKLIGFTILKTYNYKNRIKERNFWGIRNYKVHFFGKELKIKSLAFQEQDSVLAACATTAIWSMLHKAAKDYNTTLKTPSQITKNAGDIANDGSRLFPNKGLDINQICRAIFKSGLVCEVKQGRQNLLDEKGNVIRYFLPNNLLKQYLNAYSSVGIPIILVVDVTGNMNLHALTVSGYSKSDPKPITPKNEISLLSDSIEKLYAHDDQFGPFGRIEFSHNDTLITLWSENSNAKPTIVKNIIIPLYPKIRISYEDVYAIVVGLDRILTIFFGKSIKFDLAWDVKLRFSAKHKGKLNSYDISIQKKLELLIESYPKYIWVATCFISSEMLIEFIFDATDVNNGIIGLDIISRLDILKPGISKLLLDFIEKNEDAFSSLFGRVSENFYNFLKTNLESRS